ncbi:MAG: hypothetical protein NTX50_12980 [Candidatus Sumerlaeota bacterium]|nr:hypothetical protein [Candidatus Sumerlaeota bacterium]
MFLILIMSIFSSAFCGASAKAAVVAEWDFTKGTQKWQPNERVANLRSTGEGLEFETTAEDPWITGPAANFPADRRLRLTIRMKSNAEDGAGEFFFGPKIDPALSKRFNIHNDGAWHEYQVLIREGILKPGGTIRLDPCSGKGKIAIAWLKVEALAPTAQLKTEKPGMFSKGAPAIGAAPAAGMAPAIGAAAEVKMTAGDISVVVPIQQWGGWRVAVNGAEMARAHDHEFLAYVAGERTVWVDLAAGTEASSKLLSATSGPGTGARASEAIVSDLNIKDADGGVWTLQRTMRAHSSGAALEIELSIQCDRDRDLIYFPWLTLFPGLYSFGEKKQQAVFAGLEYLSNEPSSSEAEIRGPGAIRRLPNPVKIAFPLMTIAAEGRWLGLMWEPADEVCAVFDSPDRVYKSGAHLMGLVAPAFDKRSYENDFMAGEPLTLKAGNPLSTRAMLIGGNGTTVVPSLQRYIALKPLLPVPEFPGGLEAAARLLTRGWTDSAAREGGLWRHAVWGNSFPPHVAPDAAANLAWLKDHIGGGADMIGKTNTVDLAGKANTSDLIAKANAAISQSLAAVPKEQPYTDGVSHVRTPAAPLLFGRIEAYLDHRRAEARNLIREFDAQGIRHYHPAAGKPNYAETNPSDYTNGIAATPLARILEAAALTADAEITSKGLWLLDQQTRLYAGDVPRGAQPWEMPLHTPDPLSSAYMIQCYVWGYKLTGEAKFLEQARYWAWTGVPFVYLEPPIRSANDGTDKGTDKNTDRSTDRSTDKSTDKSTDRERARAPVGLYGTCGVMGATNWQAPLWLGQPVQWIGLVYAAALHRLAPLDPGGPWQTIARGITATGLQMTWPADDPKNRGGLLPDYYLLRDQQRDGPAINPGTVGATLPELFSAGTLYDSARVESTGWFAHAPCRAKIASSKNDIALALDGAGSNSYFVLIAGVKSAPARIVFQAAVFAAPPQSIPVEQCYNAKSARLIIPIKGKGSLRIALSQ